jgi:hypothetical protein
MHLQRNGGRESIRDVRTRRAWSMARSGARCLQERRRLREVAGDASLSEGQVRDASLSGGGRGSWDPGAARRGAAVIGLPNPMRAPGIKWVCVYVCARTGLYPLRPTV